MPSWALIADKQKADSVTLSGGSLESLWFKNIIISQYFNSSVCVRALSTLNNVSGGLFSFRIKVIVASLNDGGSSPLLQGVCLSADGPL